MRSSFSLTYRRNAAFFTLPWVPVTKAWHSNADNWLIAHDLYHHRPCDQGTLFEELASFGAQYYVEHEGRQDSLISRESLFDGLEGTVATAWEAFDATVDSFVAKPSDFLQKFDPLELSEEVLELSYTAEAFAKRYFYEKAGAPQEWTPEFRAAVEHSWGAASHQVSKAVQAGYVQARRRFPEQRLVNESHAKALAELAEVENALSEGMPLTVTLTGYVFGIDSLSRQLLEEDRQCAIEDLGEFFRTSESVS